MGNVMFSPAITKTWPETAERRQNSKTQQMFQSTNRTRESKEIQWEATEVLRAEHTDF